MSAAERTNDSAMKSAPSSAASAEVGDVLLGDRRQLRPRVGDVDALARRQRARGDARARPRRRRRSRTTAKRGTPSPITISERSVTSAGELVEVDLDRSPGRPARERRPRRRPRPRAARSPPDSRSFGPCRSNSSAERPAGALRRPRAPSAARRRRSSCVAVRAVQPRAVQPGRDQRVQHAGGVGGGPQRRHDLRSSLEHGRSVHRGNSFRELDSGGAPA